MHVKQTAMFWFFREIVNHKEAQLHKENIFTRALERKEAPSWFLYFTMDDCSTCKTYRPLVSKLARFFHHEDKEFYNTYVAEINCSHDNSLQICQYFGISKIPRFTYLSQLTGKLHVFPTRSNREFDKLLEFTIFSF